ncbi:IS110 family transposase [Mycobacterium intracellulare]|jgi:transposase|uniref:IS110 family transposase n=1 Tax=Mycobacterium intracellulare TaxID=1767 RepID=UPI001CD9D4C4|nr:IS110 family transposase [Mycobacterium intracellulare]MCA2312657.1 IS110 family transposase [Mycobacterium intracellulare subsp. chimaera]MCA2354971.1 IS110 family transposase [Mycobacterium intracellulare subsp. chimaera]MDM3934951.1 IS110 family transposase [Mycobacterium intracellulare subsp. chimaera]
MPADPTDVFVGVDTHADTHHVAVVDCLGRHLGDREFPADPGGYRRLLDWIVSFGSVAAAGVEGTGTYGAQLGRVLTAAGLAVIEVNRPDRATRRANGKSDPVDAYAAAQAVASGRAAGVPKSRDGIVESIRCLRVARRSAVKAKTQCINQIRGLLITGPIDLREQMKPLGATALIQALSRLRPGTELSSPVEATKLTLRSLARRHIALSVEIGEFDAVLDELTAEAAPGLLAKAGVGTEVAGQLLVTAGDNPERLRSEASFAHLAGVAPIPASSGRTNRHRLNRGGDRAANKALHTIAVVRLKYDERTRTYARRRTAEGLSKKDIMRCLKRAIAREIYQELTRPTGFTTAPGDLPAAG